MFLTIMRDQTIVRYFGVGVVFRGGRRRGSESDARFKLKTRKLFILQIYKIGTFRMVPE
jgi:hypothetical protein